MGLIRSGVVITLSSILFLTLFLGNGMLTLNWSLEYENVAPNVQAFSGEIVEQLGVADAIVNNYELMQNQCGSYDTFTYDGSGFNLDIPCDVVRLGSDAVINYSVSEFFYNAYHKEYDCSFWECMKKTDNGALVLISAKANDYWKSKFKLAILLSVVLVVLMLLVLESRHSVFTITGILMIVSAFPYRKLNWVLGFLPDGSLTDLFMALFARSYNVFLIMTIIGTVLFAIGIAFEFLGFGLKFSKFLGLFKGNSKEKEKDDKGKKGESALGETDDAPEDKSDDESFSKEEVKEIVRDEIKKINTEKKIRTKVRKKLSGKAREDLKEE